MPLDLFGKVWGPKHRALLNRPPKFLLSYHYPPIPTSFRRWYTNFCYVAIYSFSFLGRRALQFEVFPTRCSVQDVFKL
ncbi:unnamed protein product [Victoria cruziana]